MNIQSTTVQERLVNQATKLNRLSHLSTLAPDMEIHYIIFSLLGFSPALVQIPHYVPMIFFRSFPNLECNVVILEREVLRYLTWAFEKLVFN